VLPDHRERVHSSEPARSHPLQRLGAAVHAQHARVVLVQPARRAVLDPQLAPAGAAPELAVLLVRHRHEIPRNLTVPTHGCARFAPLPARAAHAGSVPSTTVPCVDSQPPLPLHTAISAPATWLSPASPRNCRVPSHSRYNPRIPGCVDE